MKLIIEPTDQFEVVEGGEARVWTGQSADGVKVTCWISIVAVKASDDTSQFERELIEIGAPKP